MFAPAALVLPGRLYSSRCSFATLLPQCAENQGFQRRFKQLLTMFLECGLTQQCYLPATLKIVFPRRPAMSHSLSLRVGGMQKLARNPVLIATFMALSLAGCASKKGLPNNAADLGLGANGANGGAGGAPGSQQDFTVNVGDRIFFDTDSSSIRPDAAQTLDRQAQWLAQYPNYSIIVEGHADERGTREYNLALGGRRAQATRDYLASKGVPANRMRTISYGKERPVASCDDISCWSQNRRAVTVLGSPGM
jgi:peptidoglycan-associated lipoprotein